MITSLIRRNFTYDLQIAPEQLNIYARWFIDDLFIPKMSDIQKITVDIRPDHKDNVMKFFQTLGEPSNSPRFSSIASSVVDVSKNLAKHGSLTYKISYDEGDYSVSRAEGTSKYEEIISRFLNNIRLRNPSYSSRPSVVTSHRFHIPAELGGAAKILRLLNAFQSIGAISELKNDRDFIIKYNLSEIAHSEYQKVALLRIAKDFGWDMRDYDPQLSKYYIVYRGLLFKKSKTLLLNHIIKEINNLLSKLKLEAVVAFEEMTVRSIDSLLSRLQTGEATPECIFSQLPELVPRTRKS